MDTTVRLHRTVPERFRTDVLVAGGGLGGIAAAVAAARAGASVALVERNGFVGGVATAGMCCSVFNCFYSSAHRRLVNGLAVEITDLLAREAGSGDSWHAHAGHIIYDVERAKYALARLLLREGVRLLLDTPVVDAVMDGDRLRGLIVHGKRGLYTIGADVVLDATGDADVAALAGAPVHTHTSGSSYLFRIGNVDMDAFADYFRRNPDQYPERMDIDWSVRDALAQYEANGTFLFPHGGGMQMDIVREGLKNGELKSAVGCHDTVAAMQMHGLRDRNAIHIITGFTRVPDLDDEAITRAMVDGQEMAFHVADFFRRRMPGFERSFVINTADDLGIRTSRWIDGAFVFTREMKQTPSRFPDAIGRGVVETHKKLHNARDAWSAQVFEDDYYEIPLRCLVPQRIRGLLMAAGRSASADPPSLLRVMATTMVVGQGAGIAAAVAQRNGTGIPETPYEAIRQELERQGAMEAEKRSGAFHSRRDNLEGGAL